MFCLLCGKEIGDINKNRICPYCGHEQYTEPGPEAYRAAGQLQARMSAPQKKQKREKQPMFTDEERLALGLYPDDEVYKMSLIAKISDKHR